MILGTMLYPHPIEIRRQTQLQIAMKLMMRSMKLMIKNMLVSKYPQLVKAETEVEPTVVLMGIVSRTIHPRMVNDRQHNKA